MILSSLRSSLSALVSGTLRLGLEGLAFLRTPMI